MPEEPRNENPPVSPEPSPVDTNPEPVTEQPTAEPVVTDQPATEEPAAEQPFVAQPVVTEAPKKKGLKKPALIGIIIAAALVVLGGGGALAYNLWYQNPDKVVTDALMNAVTAKTVSATGVLEGDTDSGKIKIEVSGRADSSANSLVSVKLNFEGDGVSIAANGEGIFSAEGDMYVKLNDARELVDSFERQAGAGVSFAAFDSIIEKIDGNWVKISRSDLGTVSEEYEKTQKCFADISKSFESDKAFKDKVVKETSDLYKKHKFIVVGEKIGVRTINDQASLGYKFTGDKEAAKAFFTGLEDTELLKKLKECDSTIDLNDIVSDATSDDTDATQNAEIWVSRFGHTLTEIKTTGTSDDTTGTLVINPVFNKDEAVEIPTDVVTFSELQRDIEALFVMPQAPSASSSLLY